MATKKPGAVKELSSLNKLLESNPPVSETQSAFMSDKGAVILDPTLDLSMNIYRIMSDYEGRTVKEMAVELASVEPDMTVVKNTVTWLMNAGWFHFTRQTAQVDVVYKLKRTLKIDAFSKKKAVKQPVKTFQMPQQAIINPAGIIRASESLDLSIWKTMSDRQTRCAHEIGSILATYGVDRRAVQDRAIVLMKRGWFTRTERGSVTYYTLKKHIQMPVDDPKLTAMEATPGLTLVRSAPVTQQPMFSGPLDAMAFQHAPATPASEQAAAPLKASAIKQEPAFVTPLVLKEDHITVKIWKVMSDYKPYTANEVTVLLSDFNIPIGTVSARMSILNNHYDWFDTDKSAKATIYTLRRTIPMPPDASWFKEPRPTSAETTTQPQQPVTSETTVMSSPAKVTSSLITPLVEIIIRIKGIDFTFSEAHEIAKHLISQGYGVGTPPASKNALISTNVVIKGQMFDPSELEVVAVELRKNQFGRADLK